MKAAPVDLAAYRAGHAEPEQPAGSVLTALQAARDDFRADWPGGQPTPLDADRDKAFGELIERERVEPSTLENSGGLFGDVHDRLVRIEARLTRLERRGRL